MVVVVENARGEGCAVNNDHVKCIVPAGNGLFNVWFNDGEPMRMKAESLGDAIEQVFSIPYQSTEEARKETDVDGASKD